MTETQELACHAKRTGIQAKDMTLRYLQTWSKTATTISIMQEVVEFGEVFTKIAFPIEENTRLQGR
jgi:hypothetical protein